MEEYKEALEDMLKRLLNGEWSVTKFKGEFYMFYLEEVPTELLSDDEWLFYSTIHQSLDCIVAASDSLGTPSGWKNHQEYIDWVWNQHHLYLKAKAQNEVR